MKHAVYMIIVILSSSYFGGCLVVPQNRRAPLADPIMATFDCDSLEAHKNAKFYSTREAAAGGDGAPAGGGCGCQ